MPKWQEGLRHFDRVKEKNRVIKVPNHRYNAIKKAWVHIYTPIVEQCKLEVRMNLKIRSVEIRPSAQCENPKQMLQKAEDFVRAFILGFEVQDAIAMLRMDDIFVDSFETKDVKRLPGEHLGRAIGRMSGTRGKTKFTIENATRTRIVIADRHIHIMGTFQNIRVARRAFSDLIRGSPAAKVYNSVRGTMNRVNESL
jgi:RNA-binding protein PNO1